MRLSGFTVSAIATALAAITFTSTLLAEKKHSLALQLDKTDDLIQVHHKYFKLNYDTEPELVSIRYSYTFNEDLSISSLIQTGGDDLSDSGLSNVAAFLLDQNIIGFGSAVNYRYDDWTFGLGASLNTSKADIAASSKAQRVRSLVFNESIKSSAVTMDAAYDFDYENFVFSTMLTLGYQRTDTEIDLELSHYVVLNGTSVDTLDTNSEFFEGGYLSPAITVYYLLDGSDELLLLPSLSLVWSETIWGETSSYSNTLRSGVLKKSDLQTESAESGSGSASISLMVLWGDYYGDVSVGQSFSSDSENQTMSFSLGMDF